MTVPFEVVTPDRVVLETEVEMVSLRGGGGELGILPRHTPLSATVKPGLIKIKFPEGEDYMVVASGFIQVLPTRITLLVDTAETAAQIEVERAERARDRAERRLADNAPDLDAARANAARQRALHRLEAVELSTRNGEVLKQRGSV